MTPHESSIPVGLCQCGCGEETSRYRTSNARRGEVRGEYCRFVNRHARRLSGVEYLIEDHGYKTPCWIWQRAKDDEGYGFITVPKRESGSRCGRAHTVYYERKYGKIPVGMLPDHLCRVHSCVNPDHIEPVTYAENTRRGLSAKLNENKVREIKALLSQGVLQDELAIQFGVEQTLISRIKLGKAWRGVE
jgi:hypothetical protein